ncbi:unnamed protein product [Chilo suppressalis]|uniref:Kazal-like domain-containing protein n=1 Tax=Chilo suppressalis TaxID=168631 RepID=A0ABN8AUC3_CHISP|nr:unnamed protein product [Chilo suppressalis]
MTCDAENKLKRKFCEYLFCNNSQNRVCGIKVQGNGVKLRIFDSECELLKYGCDAEDEEAYGIINLEYCERSHLLDNLPIPKEEALKVTECVDFDCSYPSDAKRICAMRQEGDGFRVRLFSNKCHLIKYNCVNALNFTQTEFVLCDGVNITEAPYLKTTGSRERKIPNLFIVDANMYNFNNNVNDTIDNFFAATHIFNLPVDELNKHVNETARRMLLNVFGPQVIFKPWTIIPKNITEDRMHEPTLGSCFHRCPKKCPNTYAPVCGQPGVIALEPSLMFKNHCFMDAAQCKMRWEDKSPTAESSSYIEANFLFCLGDTMNTLYRFLPLVRTLQHMGRLKKRGHFRYHLRNMRFLNNMLIRDMTVQGR